VHDCDLPITLTWSFRVRLEFDRFGKRSFRLSAPSVWNDLPSELKNSDINRQGFKSNLKSWLFERAYS